MIAPVYGAYAIEQKLFWFVLVSYLVLLPTSWYEVMVRRSIPRPLLPNIFIFAAPARLCMAGYLGSFGSEDLLLVSVLLGLSLASYLAVRSFLPKC